MSKNLGDTLGNLGLSLDSESQFAAGGTHPWWCFWPCLGVACHGATNSLNYCNGAPCYGGAANLIPQPPACAYGTLNYDNTA
jgi:hypothetical protein